jgi:hypothetical protein
MRVDDMAGNSSIAHNPLHGITPSSTLAWFYISNLGLLWRFGAILGDFGLFWVSKVVFDT